jgi:predicted nuclease of restriction endonuclease-like (RecB) superfamily
MKKSISLPKSYIKVLNEIKTKARNAQISAIKRVNQELILLYWNIGKILDHKIKSEKWGSAIIDSLVVDLQKEFTGSLGFSRSNLYQMVKFYQIYGKLKIVQTLSGQLSWSHFNLLLSSCETEKERTFYAKKSIEHGWSVRVLNHQIEAKAFESSKKTQSNFKSTLPKVANRELLNSIKDEYVFDFLDLEESHSEKQLEQGLLQKINAFLIEMGGVFSFIGNQYRLTVDGDDFFVDILLFHRRLRCMVAIELKIGEFKPEYAGKMQFYLTALNETAQQPGENPSIGIILCKSKKKTIVEYALKEAKQPIAVATYRVTTELPIELRKELPTPKQIETLFKITDANPIVQTVSGQLKKKKAKRVNKK